MDLLRLFIRIRPVELDLPIDVGLSVISVRNDWATLRKWRKQVSALLLIQTFPQFRGPYQKIECSLVSRSPLIRSHIPFCNCVGAKLDYKEPNIGAIGRDLLLVLALGRASDKSLPQARKDWYRGGVAVWLRGMGTRYGEGLSPGWAIYEPICGMGTWKEGSAVHPSSA